MKSKKMEVARKSLEKKLDNEKVLREKLALELQKKPADSNLPAVLLPEVYNKVLEVSKYIEDNLKESKGLTALQITPLIAKKSIHQIAVSGINASYTPQELAIAFNYYIELMAEINKHTTMPPSKISFCQLLGISTTTYNNYMLDPEKQEIMQMIDDYIASSVITSAQLGELKEISSMFVNKSQHKWIEESAPNTIVYESKPNIDAIKKQFYSLRKESIKEAEYEEKAK